MVYPTLAKFARLAKLDKFAKFAVTLAKLAFASTLFSSYLPNSPWASTYFSDILAKLNSCEYLFLTYSQNSTCASHNINMKCTAVASASTRDICKICTQVAIA